MKQLILIVLALLCHLISFGQGIKFESDLTWTKIKLKAKAENKIIFLDVFATWCAPCREMDRNIYTKSGVATIINSKFIPYKLQADSTKNDVENIKMWYQDAKQIISRYKINSFPSFLFFSPEGDLIYKETGYKNEMDFVRLISEVLKTNVDYESLIGNFRKGTLNRTYYTRLIKLADENKDMKLGDSVAGEYTFKYLTSAPKSQLLTLENLIMISNHPKSTVLDSAASSPFFKYLATKQDSIDNIVNFPGFSNWFLTNIYRSVVTDQISRLGHGPDESDWTFLKKALFKKINIEAIEVNGMIYDGYITYYRDHQSYNQAIKYFVRKVDLNGLMSLGPAPSNEIGALLLPHCTDKEILLKAASWVFTDIITGDPLLEGDKGNNNFGIYGGLLYKAGRKVEGIKWMESRIALLSASKSTFAVEKRQKTMCLLNKMMKNEKIDDTWNIQDFF
jgi:thioredoxin-related protein